MKKLHFKTVMLCLCMAFFFSAKAQIYIGIPQSNYAGLLGGDLNPANLADNRLKFDMVIVNFNFALNDNYAYFLGSNLPYGWLKSFKGENNDWRQDNFYENNFVLTPRSEDGKPVGYYQSYQMDLFSFMATINPKSSFGVSFRSRTFTGINSISPELTELAIEDFNVPDFWFTQLTEENLTMGVNSWNEFGFTYATEVYNENENFIKVGGKVKLTQGIAGIYLNLPESKYEFINADTAINVTGTASYGYSNSAQDILDDPMQLFNFGAGNIGVAFDLGVVYEYRPDYAKHKTTSTTGESVWDRSTNKYLLRAGLSVIDLGGVKYGNAVVKTFDISTNSLAIDIFDNANNLVAFDSIMEANFTKTSESSSYYMWLPTTLNLTLDYNIHKDFYVDFIGSFGVQGMKNDNKVWSPRQLQITPRWELPWLTIAMPFGYNKFAGWRTGLGIRIGPLTFGTNNLLVLLAPGDKVQGAELYAGLRLSLRHKPANN